MLGTATKSEQDTLIERMNAEIARLREELNVVMGTAQYWVNECEDLASQNSRLREELSRAGAETSSLGMALGLFLQDFKQCKCASDPPMRHSFERAEDALAESGEVQSAARGVLEAAVEERCAEDQYDHAETLAQQALAKKELRAKRSERAEAVDRYQALLEGRDREEG